MSILSEIMAPVATPTTTGFHGEVLTPDNFKDKNDGGLLSQITSYMGNVAGAGGSSTAKVALNFATCLCSTPIATRTTRRFIVRGRLYANMVSAPAGSSCTAGFRYSLNGGGAFTTIVETTDSTPGTFTDTGTNDYVVVITANDFTQFIIEGYTSSSAGPGGATSDVPYGRVFAQHGYFEDFESAVNLLRIYPSSGSFVATPFYGPSDLAINEGLSRDGVLTTGSTIHVERTDNDPNNYNEIYQEALFSAQPVGGGVVHAQIIWYWEGNAFISETASVDLTIHSNASCTWEEHTGLGFSTTSDPLSYIDRVHAEGNGTSTRTKALFVRDITSLFREVSQVKMRMLCQVTHTFNPFLNHNVSSNATVYEMYMEIRVPAGSGVMGGWEAV